MPVLRNAIKFGLIFIYGVDYIGLIKIKIKLLFCNLRKYAPCYACQHMLLSCARITEKW